MSPLATIVAYKIVTMCIGMATVFLGYKLFQQGVFQKENVEATFGDAALLIKKASPGTVFAAFGCFVICVSIFKGFEVSGSPEANGVVSAFLVEAYDDARLSRKIAESELADATVKRNLAEAALKVASDAATQAKVEEARKAEEVARAELKKRKEAEKQARIATAAAAEVNTGPNVSAISIGN